LHMIPTATVAILSPTIIRRDGALGQTPFW
jgi:hypothetical protein